jgi:hypothetical protein
MKKGRRYTGITGFIAGLLLMQTGWMGVRADEGMWIPLLIEKYNILRMQEAGLQLSAEDIYSINQDCLKDAIVIFGRGCTGEIPPLWGGGSSVTFLGGARLPEQWILGHEHGGGVAQ